ncbi:hypothetical protein GCM10027449_05860 [Sinomonas notoginsengisoli]|uniref:LytR C-terminal domain-containing protein n=1 Tax=Sinomonas notoginsengisoli TaxID=1457311 RepID=UPI001F28B996|nr:LytR C-terminal domain-containing protein [Sinomonas notoginsengisoli]
MARKPQDLTRYHGHHVVSGSQLRTQFEEDADARQRSRQWRKARHAVAIGLLAALLFAGVGAALEVLSGRLTIPEPGSKPTHPTTCPSGTYDYLPPEKVTVNVLNGAGKEGLAAEVADQLKARKFIVRAVGNERTAMESPAVVRGGFGGEAAAFTLQRNVPGSVYIRDGRSDASVDLILGSSFKVLTDPAVVDQTPGPIACTLPTASSTAPTSRE